MFNFFKTKQSTVDIDVDRAARMQRNQERMAKLNEEMGSNWIMHPANKKSKLDKPRNWF